MDDDSDNDKVDVVIATLLPLNVANLVNAMLVALTTTLVPLNEDDSPNDKCVVLRTSALPPMKDDDDANDTLVTAGNTTEPTLNDDELANNNLVAMGNTTEPPTWNDADVGREK